MQFRITALTLSLMCVTMYAQTPDRVVDDDQRAREEWFYNQRAFPFGQIPAGARMNAIAEIRRMDQAARARHRSVVTATAGNALAITLDSANWTSIGPKPTDQGSTYVTAGRVNALAIDPRDNNTVYMGAAEGGIWKTTDGGVSWKPITDDQASLAMGSIVLDPANPDIVYAGTGEENFAQDSYYGAGILKSTDGGATWSNIVGPFLRDKIGAIAVSPDSKVLLCTSTAGVWRSTDAAATWSRVLTGTGTSVIFDPTNGSNAFAALGNPNGATTNGVYRSTDGGLSWTLLKGGLPTASVGRIDLTLAPSTPSTVYAAISNSASLFFGSLLGIYKTTDSGDTWNNTNAPDVCNGVAQCWYDMSIRVNPKNPDVVWAVGSVNVIRSLNGGASWSQVSLVGPNGVEMHVDEHYLAFTPDGTKLYVANDGGVYSTADISSFQVSWSELNDTLGITQFYPGLSIHPSNSSIGYGGAQDNGTQRFGGNTSWNNVTCGDGGYTAIDTAVPTIAFAACQNIQILRTTNNGNSWSTSQHGIPTNDRTNFISPLAIDPSNSQNIYFGTYRLFQARDSGGKWVAISPDLTARTSANIRAIGIAPADGNTVYVGSSDLSRVSTSGAASTLVQVTNNALDPNGATWTDRSSGLPTRVVSHITVDSIDPATAYATFSGFSGGIGISGHIFKTTNFGANWADISGNLPDIPVDDIVVDPDIPSTLYIGTDTGVMVSTDGGATWSTLGNGFPNTVVHSLVLHRASRTLRAATHGRSMWDILVPLPGKSQQPTIATLSPTTVNAGSGDFTLSATGSNFATGTVLRWNGQSRPTTIVDGSHLTAKISASDVAQVGRIAVDAFGASAGQGPSNPVAFSIGPAPATNSAAFVSAANPFSGNALAPGSIATLYGTNLAGSIVVADGGPPLPTTLGGTSISIFNAPAPLFFVAPGQVNFQIPWIISNGTVGVPLQVSTGLLSSPAIIVSIAPFAPAMFTTNAQGSGQASALIAGTAIIAAPGGTFPGSRPAQKGEFVSLYCTGLGNVTRRPNPGSASPSNPLSSTLTLPTVTVGGVNATVSFSGLAPTLVGVYVVNIQIPNGAPSGDAVPVVLNIGGVPANTVTIAVQ